MNHVDEDVLASRRRTWMLGGVLLIVVALLWFGIPLGKEVLTGWAAFILQVVAFAVFAIGLGRQGSVTARRPVGTIALVALGVWALVGPVSRVLMTPPTDAEPDALGQYATTVQVVTTTIDVAGLALGVIAAVQIVRARVVPSPWRWLPPAALVVVVAARVLHLLAIQPSGLPLSLDAAFFLRRLDVVATPLTLLLLGIAAVALATLSVRRVSVSARS